MTAALIFSCNQHTDPFDCADNALVYHPLFREYGLVIHDGGMSYLLIDHCPFCGEPLPEPKRDGWFDEVERLGLDDTPLKDLPDHLKL